MPRSRRIAVSILGSTLDVGGRQKRKERWRPTVGLCLQDDTPIDELHLLVSTKTQSFVRTVANDIEQHSPSTRVVAHPFSPENPWDFEEVFSSLLQFARAFTKDGAQDNAEVLKAGKGKPRALDPDVDDLLVHITTGTHVMQICLFLLTESRFLPGKLAQTRPNKERMVGSGNDTFQAGDLDVIDLDLSRYVHIQEWVQVVRDEGKSFLKQGIATKNKVFNGLIADLETVTTASDAPVLLMGPTGAGKTALARRVYDLKKARRRVKGKFVEVNCATLRGDQAMSTLFGHKKGAFTGADKDRDGLLVQANEGLLFLDEIGELGLDEQAMLLSALETGRFFPLGSDKERTSSFFLIAGTNRDLNDEVHEGRFREDLLARIELWTFPLPGLKDRREDIAPNLQFELSRFSDDNAQQVRMTRDAQSTYLAFAQAPTSSWRGNFRDLSSSVIRMGTLAHHGTITKKDVDDEVARLQRQWRGRDGKQSKLDDDDQLLRDVLGDDAADLDPFDRVQLAFVIRTCRSTKTASEAGRVLFAQSRQKKTSSNDADRLRKYLQRFQLHFADVQQGAAT